MQLKRVNWEKLSIAGLEDTVWGQVWPLYKKTFYYNLPFSVYVVSVSH